MNIVEAKEQIRYAVSAYLERDEDGAYKIPLARQRPLMLIGAPGIGKTAVVEQVASELGIGLVSYSMTHHTRQSALGLPVIVHRECAGVEYDASEYTMSEIISSIYELMEESGVREGVLFLDEVNCVSETLAPSMLQFLQYKTFGRHRVPDGWVIVTAGNPPEYNRSVHEFDVATLDRVRRIDVDPDYEAWKPYAYEAGVHEAVLSFLSSKPDRFFRISRGEAGREFVTPRSWVDLSEAMKLHEEMGFPVDSTLVSQYIQASDVAEEFALYYELFERYRGEYGVEGILAGRFDEALVSKARDAALDERLSLLGLLIDDAASQMKRALAFEDELASERGALREVMERSRSSEEPRAVLEELASAEEEKASRAASAGSLSCSSRRASSRLSRQLRSYASALGASSLSGEEALASLEAAYEGRVESLSSMEGEASASLSNVFSFVEAAFSDGPEMVVLVTELTARPHCARFISEHGSEEYFAHNEDLLLSSREKDLRRRIEAQRGPEKAGK